MKVVHLSSFCEGGAEIAALRLHECLLQYGGFSGWNSSFRALLPPKEELGMRNLITDPVLGSNRLSRSIQARRCHRRYSRFQPRNQEAHSIAWPASGLPWELRQDPPSLVHLHNIRNLLISIEEIGQLSWPIVWSAHDHWPFAGAEHHPTDFRWREGFGDPLHLPNCSSFDLNAWTWRRKLRAWRHPCYVVCASNWMLEECRASALADLFWPVVIPYPLDLEIFRPYPRRQALQEFGFPDDQLLLLFGASGGLSNPRKGGDLLLKAMAELAPLLPKALHDRVILGVFGGDAPAIPPSCPFQIRWLGVQHEPACLARLYSAAQCFVMPSRQEPFGQVATESLACGTPVVAFAVGGVIDNVQTRINGFLAEPFYPGSLARALASLLLLPQAFQEAMRVRAASSVRPRLHGSTIALQLMDVYGHAIARHQHRN